MKRVITGRWLRLVTLPLVGVLVSCDGEPKPEPPRRFAIRGTITGLAGELVLQNNGGDDLIVRRNGTFTLPTGLTDGSAYAITIAEQPTDPDQDCTVENGVGFVQGADVVDVAIRCVTKTYRVGGTVVGLAGSGLVLQNNGTDDLEVTDSGSFFFATRLEDGASYRVTVRSHPSGPRQSCAVTGGAGSVQGAEVRGVLVVCQGGGFTIGGTVSGLAGAGLALHQSGGDRMAISANGVFRFATPVPDGSEYVVSVAAQPAGPSQRCNVTGGSGTIAGRDVDDVRITCETNRFTVGGVVTGLAGTGLVLRQSGGDELQVTSSGAFTFPTRVLDGSPFAVTIASQPVDPRQSCSVSGGFGSVNGDAVTSVVVQCQTESFPVSGTVTGLAGSGLVLRLNGTGDLPVAADGAFVFPGPLPDGSAYVVTVAAHPVGLSQTCIVHGGTGILAGRAVGDVVVRCETNTFTLGGTVSGLAGSALVLQNGSDSVLIQADGPFTFPGALRDGASYDVTVGLQPSGPRQQCSVTGGTGSIAGADAEGVSVTCATLRFSVGGTVTGLAGSGLVLRLNGTGDLPISADGAFLFPATLADGTAYEVTVAAEPTNLNQTCTVTAGSGTLSGAAISDVAVRCETRTYSVGGTVSGLSGLGLKLQQSGADAIVLSGDGAFTFPGKLLDGSPFAVAIAAQPVSPSQSCSVSGGDGVVSGKDVTTIMVTCTTNTFTVSGTISGLLGSGLALQQSGGDTLNDVATTTATFTFPTPLADGSPYSVTVSSQPLSPRQECSVTGGAGVLRGENVTDVAVHCVTKTFTVGGTVSGLAGSGLVLRQSGGDDRLITTNGSFTFATPLADLSAYAVSVAAQPTNLSQTCTVSGGSGAIDGQNVSSISVQCVTNPFTVSGSVTGLRGEGLFLFNNGADGLNLTASGTQTFTFPTPLADGSAYSVTVGTQPTNPTQTCTVASGTGTIQGGPVDTVAVVCSGDRFTVGGTVSGLEGIGLMLQLNGAEVLGISDNGAFRFPADLRAGTPYEVTVANPPSSPNQACIVEGGSGVVRANDIDSVQVKCIAVAGQVLPYYTGFGAGWNHYLLFDGPDVFSATGAACPGAPTDRCFHAGLMRVLDVSGRFSDCSGVTAEDKLGALEWRCLVRDDKVLLVSTGLKHGARISDLIDFNALQFHFNQLIVRHQGEAALASVPDFFFGSGAFVDVAPTGTPPLTLDGNGFIYVVQRNPNQEIAISGERIWLVVRPDVTLTGSGSGPLVSASGKHLWIEGKFYAAGHSDGIVLSSAHHSVAHGVTVEAAGAVDPGSGIVVTGSSRNRLSDIRVANNSANGIILENGSEGNHLEDILAVQNREIGVIGEGAPSTSIDRAVGIGNGPPVPGEQGGGIGLLDDNSVMTNITGASNQFVGVGVGGADSVLFNATAANSLLAGVIAVGPNNLLVNVAATGNDVGFQPLSFNGDLSLLFVDTAFAGNATHGIVLDAGSSAVNATFRGLLKVGQNGTADCLVSASSSGLTDGSCAPVSPSDATLVSGVSLAGSFVGKVVSDDPRNASDTDGAAAFHLGLDWFSFANEQRGWGADGTFPGGRGPCGPDIACRIWDWSLAVGDTGDAGSPAIHTVFTGLPTGNDTIAFATSAGPTRIFLRHATEIRGDFVGNDDGLCESNERCLLTPNIGGYQGHGRLVPAGTFSDGTLTGITLLRFEHNGR